MRQTFIKDGNIRSYEVQDGKVIATLLIDGVWVSNPTLEAFYADGWEDYIAPEPPAPEPYIPTYAELVEQYIREHGYETYGAELAILNNHAQDPMTYADAYAAYMQTRTDAKTWAGQQPHREEESV